jgi:dTDP-4-amino-4,6-dideoxygalactose transaminase
MPKAIPCIPHKQRLEAHKVDYLKSIAVAMDHPWQSEDGREPSPTHQELESKCRHFTDIKFWQFTNCCTDALQVAFHAFCKPGDTVIVPAYGWRAIMNAPLFVGLNVVFCDIDDTGNVDLNLLKDLVKKHKPAAVLIVHNFGTIVNVSHIKTYCELFGVKIIEDAAPSFTMNEPYAYKLGAASDAVCFSFDFTKSPGTLGAGGALATNKPENYEKFQAILSHTTTKHGVGTKSYLDTVAAAVLNKEMILIEQNQYRKKKVEIATFYINNIPYKTLSGENYIFHRFIILPEKNEKINLVNRLKSQKILAKPVYAANTDTCQKANEFISRAVELPCHQFIDISDLKQRLNKVI